LVEKTEIVFPALFGFGDPAFQFAFRPFLVIVPGVQDFASFAKVRPLRSVLAANDRAIVEDRRNRFPVR
jgi:hypothetical protein